MLVRIYLIRATTSLLGEDLQNELKLLEKQLEVLFNGESRRVADRDCSRYVFPRNKISKRLVP
jgi:hypothetical protein